MNLLSSGHLGLGESLNLSFRPQTQNFISWPAMHQHPPQEWPQLLEEKTKGIDIHAFRVWCPLSLINPPLPWGCGRPEYVTQVSCGWREATPPRFAKSGRGLAAAGYLLFFFSFTFCLLLPFPFLLHFLLKPSSDWNRVYSPNHNKIISGYNFPPLAPKESLDNLQAMN